MSKLLEFRKAEQALREQLAHLERLKHDKELGREIEFENKLKALLQEYGFQPQDVVDIFQQQAPEAPVETGSGRRVRKIQVWKNPVTGEELQTKSGNNKQLKAWKAEYGDSVVAAWLQRD